MTLGVDYVQNRPGRTILDLLGDNDEFSLVEEAVDIGSEKDAVLGVVYWNKGRGLAISSGKSAKSARSRPCQMGRASGMGSKDAKTNCSMSLSNHHR